MPPEELEQRIAPYAMQETEIVVEIEAHVVSEMFNQPTPDGIWLRRSAEDYCGIPMLQIRGPHSAVVDFVRDRWGDSEWLP